MSTHANIYMPIGELVLYKHFDGRPKNVLPALSQIVNESSIFLTSGRNGGGKRMWNGTDEDLLDEMGYLAHRIVIFFAIKDYQRRTSTGIKFGDGDLTGIISPMSIRVKDDMDADYHYHIERSGDIRFFLKGPVEPQVRILPYGTNMNDPLYRLAAIDDDSEDVDPR